MDSREFAVILNLFLIYIPYGYSATDCMAGPPLVNPRECCERPEVIEDSVFSKCFSEYGIGRDSGNPQERNPYNKMGVSSNANFRKIQLIKINFPFYLFPVCCTMCIEYNWCT